VPDHRRFAALMEAAWLCLEVGIGLRDPFVLAHVLGPGFDEEPFDDVIGVRSIL
jgi:hypothetical protein